MAEVRGCPRAPSPSIVVSSSPCATLGGESPDPQLDMGATFVGEAPEPQLRIAATNAAMTEAARKRLVAMTDAAGMRRRPCAGCCKQTLIWQPRLAKRSCLSSLRPGAQVRIWRHVKAKVITVPVLRIIASFRSTGSRNPVEGRRVAEQSGVYHERNLRTVEANLDRCDGRLSTCEQRPAVYEDARAAGGVERIGEPRAVHAILDHELEGDRGVLGERIARRGRRRVRVQEELPYYDIGPGRQGGLSGTGATSVKTKAKVFPCLVISAPGISLESLPLVCRSP